MMASTQKNLKDTLPGRVIYYIPVIMVAVSVLIVWELAVIVFNIEQFILPKPSDIFAEFSHETQLFLDPNEASILFESTKATLWAAFGAL